MTVVYVSPMRKMLISLAVGAVVATGVGFSGPVRAATSARKIPTYKNCTALNKAHKHGIGRRGARDKTASGTKRVTTFLVSDQGYRASSRLDRDRDGIACEKR